MTTLGGAVYRTAKRVTVSVAVAGLALSIAACSSPAATTGSEGAPAAQQPSEAVELAPVDLAGEWKQSNSKDPERWSEATVTADAITINWVADSGDTKALYWAGSVEAPADNSQSFTWDSVNDTAQTKNSLLASDAPTKTFTYADGVLSYEATAMGVTTTVKLERK